MKICAPFIIEVQKGLDFQMKQSPGDELEDIIEQLRKFPEVNPGHPPKTTSIRDQTCLETLL